MSLPSYSVAIRTLGTAGDKYKRELESIAAQTVQPERVVVYLAEGYERPAFTVGKEDYVVVKKGMVAQRALPYDEIQSDYPDHCAYAKPLTKYQGFSLFYILFSVLRSCAAFH